MEMDYVGLCNDDECWVDGDIGAEKGTRFGFMTSHV